MDLQTMTEKILSGTGFGLAEPYNGRGFLGTRYKFVDTKTGATKLGDIVVIEQGFDTARILCDNNRSIVERTRSSLLANVLAADWLSDDVYFQIIDMPPDSQLLSGSDDFFSLSGLVKALESFVTVLRYLYAAGLVHSALSPHSVCVADGQILVSELWWMHTADGSAFCPGLEKLRPSAWPQLILDFGAPELINDGLIRPSTDIYSVAKIMYFLATKQSPSANAGSQDLRKELQAVRPDLPDMFTGLVQTMLHPDYRRRPTLAMLEAGLSELNRGTAAAV